MNRVELLESKLGEHLGEIDCTLAPGVAKDIAQACDKRLLEHEKAPVRGR